MFQVYSVHVFDVIIIPSVTPLQILTLRFLRVHVELHFPWLSLCTSDAVNLYFEKYLCHSRSR